MSTQNLSLPPELGCLSAFIDSHIECLAGPDSELRSLALCAAKHIFDWALETEASSTPYLKTLLTTLAEAVPPQTRSRARGGPDTQRRSASPTQKRQVKINIRETPLPSLFIEGMTIDQIWQQLDLRAVRVCENLQILQGANEDEDINLEEDCGDDGSEDADAEMDVDDDESAWEGFSDEKDDSSSSTSTTEGDIDLQVESSEDEDEDINKAPISIMDIVCSQQKLRPPKSHSHGYRDLDDGFFDLATFNAEINEAEAKVSSKRKLDLVADEDSTEESEVDLFGSVDDIEAEGEDHAELYYNDFFESPTRVQDKNRSSKVRFHERVSVKKIKAVGKGMPVSYMDGEDEEDEDEEDEDD